jgi:hypothetical protein
MKKDTRLIEATKEAINDTATAEATQQPGLELLGWARRALWEVVWCMRMTWKKEGGQDGRILFVVMPSKSISSAATQNSFCLTLKILMLR